LNTEHIHISEIFFNLNIFKSSTFDQPITWSTPSYILEWPAPYSMRHVCLFTGKLGVPIFFLCQCACNATNDVSNGMQELLCSLYWNRKIKNCSFIVSKSKY